MQPVICAQPDSPSGPSARLAAAAVLGACLLLLGGAASVEPNPAGLGTHVQLDLPPCAWQAEQQFPCPTCGMTTSFALAVRGQLLAAVRAQPAGALLALLAVMAAWVALHVLLTGQSGVWRVVRRLWRPRTVVIGALVLGGAWAYKVVAMTWGS